MSPCHTMKIVTVWIARLALVGCWGTALAQSWVPQQSNTTASLRGVSALNPNTVWASGTNGTYLKTADGGASWQVTTVKGAADMDFRAVHAIDERTVFLLSSGEGQKSRIYKTVNGGGSWDALFTNPDPKGFFDAIAFWDEMHGIVLGDPVDGRFVVLTTNDGGATWHRRKTPPAKPQEGAFAASGACLRARGSREVWFGTGGPGGGRIFHSGDGGETWSVASTLVRSDSASAGIFSIAFGPMGLGPGPRGIAIGGDYLKPSEAQQNIAVTTDGGRKWAGITGTPPGGFRSAVEYLADRKMWIATGTSGSDVSTDDGQNWKQFDTGAYNALSFVSSAAGWAVGPKGVIARFRLP